MTTSTTAGAPAPAPPATAGSAPPAAPTVATPTTAHPEASTSRARGRVEHTPGGVPAVPAAVTAANTVVAGLSSVAVVAGPVGLAVAAAGTGAVATAAALASRSRATRRARSGGGGGAARRRLGSSAAAGQALRGLGALGKANRAARKAATGTGRSGTARMGSVAGSSRPALSRLGKHRASTAAGLKASGRGAAAASPARKAGGASAAHRAGKPGERSGRARQAVAGRAAAGRKALERVAQVRQLRKKDRAAGRIARAAKVAARRQVADARRGMKQARRAQRAAKAGRLKKAWARARHGMSGLGARGRKALRRRGDGVAENRLGRIRRLRQAIAARKRLRTRLVRARMRYFTRRLLALTLSAPLAVVGVLSTVLGRWLGWDWLKQPGRRLYRRLMGRARHQLDAETNEALAHEHHHNEDDKQVRGTVPRAPRHHRKDNDMADESGFVFNEAASEMETAAQSFDPDGMMHVLAAIESMPDGLASVAGTFKTLAERSDAEFPLAKEVGEALNEVYGLLMQAVEAAGEIGKIMRTLHEQDIARHEEPRNGEEKWDTTNNQ